MYVNIALPFRFHQGASACQMCADTTTFLLVSQNHWVMNYLDDIIGASLSGTGSHTFLTLKNLLQSLGLPINYKKISAQTHKITCLGINIYTKEGTLSIPLDKLFKSKNYSYLGRVGQQLHIRSCSL